MRKLFLFVLLFGLLLQGNFVFAQDSLLNQDFNAIIQQLKDQVEILQKQIDELKSQLETTKGELIVIKKEIIFTKTLVLGTTGDEVKKLQEFLKTMPDIYPEGRITGYFGPLTQTAIKRLQEKYGIESVGLVGPKTIAKLNELATNTVQAPTAQAPKEDMLSYFATTPKIQTPEPIPPLSTDYTTPSNIPLFTPGTPTTSIAPPPPPPPPPPPLAPETTSTVPETNTAPLAILNIEASNITSDQATIAWKTNRLAASQVEYGLDLEYHSQTSFDATFPYNEGFIDHHRTLYSLIPNTTYHYRIISEDSAGNRIKSGDKMFATLQSPPPPPPGATINKGDNKSFVFGGRDNLELNGLVASIITSLGVIIESLQKLLK